MRESVKYKTLKLKMIKILRKNTIKKSLDKLKSIY